MLKVRMMFFLCCVALTPSYASSEPELKGSPQDLRGFLHPTDKVVTISGNAVETAYSDKAIVSLVITTENELLSESISDNSLLRKKIIAALIESGIDPKAIKNSKFSSSPEYGWFGSRPSSYKVVNRMTISITQESHLKEIAVVADKHKEVELSDTFFKHSKQDEYSEKVKAKALSKIIKQKKFYESSLGLKLSAIGIRDSTVHQGATRGAMVLESAISTSAKQDKKIYSSASRYRDQSQSSSFDEIKYEASLSVDFKIEQ